jgi:hypothetical protein
MSGSGAPGGDMSMGEYRGGRNMGMGMLSGSGSGMGMGMGSMGMGMAGQDEGAMMRGNIGAASERRTASNIRRAASSKSDDSMYDDIDEQNQKTNPPAPGEKGKAAPKRKVREKEVKGIRYALITALFPHRDQVKKFTEALHTPDDPPNYEYVMIERREVLSDGSLSEWKSVDAERLKDMQKRLPEKWMPEDPAIHAAKADFPGLLMKLPELEVGSWVKYVRREAHNAAADVSGGAQISLAGKRQGGGEGESEEEAMSGVFGAGGAGGAGGAPGAAGAANTGPGGSMAMMGGGGAGRGMQPPNTGDAGMMAQMGRMGGMAGGYSGLGSQAYSGNRAPGSQPQTRTAAAKVAAQRSTAELVQIRFVDYTVEPEHTYQYRLKVVVTNPNYSRLDVMNAEENAKDKRLSSDEWSEPTPLVYVPPDMEYYVLDRVKLREEARLQVHSWMPDVGDWQYSDFPTKPGDPIGRKVPDYPLVGWEDPPKIKKTELDFSTQDLLLDVTGGDKGFTFEVDGSEFKFTERLPTEIFVIDRLGDLTVRNDDFDKNNVDRADREKYIKDVRDKARGEDKDKEKEKKPGSKAESGNRDDFDRSAPTRKGGSEK